MTVGHETANATMATNPAPRVTWEQALAWRAARHRLVDRARQADLVGVAGDIGGLHAQIMSSAELSLLARVEGLDRDALQASLWTHRTLVKLWATRGTLHLLPSAELGTWLAALGTYTKFGNAGRADIDALAKAVGRALDGQVLTREELALEVERITGSTLFGGWVRSSWGSYLKAASFRGLICFAPGDGTQVRFTSPAVWLGRGIDRPDPADAVRAITRRFLGAYAPSTPEELVRWWNGSNARTRGARMLAALGEEAVEVDVGGKRAWVLARDLPAMTSAGAPDVARLLPAFDPWVIGAARHDPMIDPRHVPRVFRPQGWISPVLLVDGRIVGVWKHERKSRDVVVELAPFGRLAARARALLEAEAERLAAFLGRELSLGWAGGVNARRRPG